MKAFLQKNRNVLTILLSAIVVLACALLIFPPMDVSADVSAEAPGGNGTADSPYQISSAGNLVWLSEMSSSHSSQLDWGFYAELTQDIDMSAVDNWSPICPHSYISSGHSGFTGVFDGKGYKIYGFHGGDKDDFGLFGCIGGSYLAYFQSGEGYSFSAGKPLQGKVTNLTIELSNKYEKDGHSYAIGGLNYDDHVGALCAYACYGYITNCKVTGGTVLADSGYVGGLCGYAEGSVFANCTNEATVFDNSTTNSYCGGICGYATYVRDYTDSGYTMGGYTQINHGCAFRYCRNTGAVSATGRYVGGICGYATTETIDTSVKSAYDNDIASIPGFISCENSGPIGVGDDYVGGILGYGEMANFESCINSGVVVPTDYSDLYDYVGGIAGRIKYCGRLVGCRNTGTVYSDDYVGGICGYMDYEEYYYNGSSKEFPSDVYAICDLYNSGNVTGDDDVGGIVGYADIDLGKLGGSYNDDCGLAVLQNKGKVSGSKYVGGIVGDIEDGWLRNCINSGEISATDSGNSAGIAGYLGSDVSEVSYCLAVKGPVAGNCKAGKLNDCDSCSSSLYNSCSGTTVTNCSAGISNDRVKSGEIAYTMTNGNPDGATWGQRIGTDDVPSINLGGENRVYYAHLNCREGSAEGYVSSDKGVTEDHGYPEHDSIGVDGKCNTCGKQVISVSDFLIDISYIDCNNKEHLLFEKVRYNTVPTPWYAPEWCEDDTDWPEEYLFTYDNELRNMDPSPYPIKALYYGEKKIADCDTWSEISFTGNITDYESAGADNTTKRKLVLRAVYDENPTTRVTLDNGSGEVTTWITAQYGTAFPQITVPEREGYVFCGYTCEDSVYSSSLNNLASTSKYIINSDGTSAFETVDGNGVRSVASRTVEYNNRWRAEDITATAVWKAINYKNTDTTLSYVRTVKYTAMGRCSDNEDASKLFDNDAATKWCYQNISQDSLEVSVIFKTSDSTLADSYTFTIANDTATYTGRNPGHWLLYGGHTETGCTYLLDEINTENILPLEAGATMTFTIPEKNRGWYEYYELHFFIGSEDHTLQLADISLDTANMRGKLVAMNLILSDSIAVNYKAVVTGYTAPYAVFDFWDDLEQSYVSTTVTSYTEGTYSGGDCIVFSFPGINPQRMRDDLKATIYGKNASGEYEVLDTVEGYSIETYLKKCFEANPSEDYCRLYSNLIAYGAAAQQCQHYEENKLISAAFADVAGYSPVTYGTGSVTGVLQHSSGAGGVNFRFVNLVISSSVMIRVKFQMEEGVSPENITIKARLGDGAEQTLPVQAGDGYYYVEYSGITATQYGKTVTFTCYAGDTVTDTLQYNVYCYLIAHYNDADPGEKSIVPGGTFFKAMLSYGYAAERIRA